MELFVAAFLVIVGIAFAVRVNVRRPVRAVPFVASAVATVVFVAVRNHYDLEESRFLWALAAFAGAACLAAFSTSLVVRQPVGRSATYGAAAAGLVLPLLVSYALWLARP